VDLQPLRALLVARVRHLDLDRVEAVFLRQQVDHGIVSRPYGEP
jgi:hypothetical protein